MRPVTTDLYITVTSIDHLTARTHSSLSAACCSLFQSYSPRTGRIKPSSPQCKTFLAPAPTCPVLASLSLVHFRSVLSPLQALSGHRPTLSLLSPPLSAIASFRLFCLCHSQHCQFKSLMTQNKAERSQPVPTQTAQLASTVQGTESTCMFVVLWLMP